jgi:tRNA threonylcarbamoyl adenosine modification protein YeaZ
MATFTLGIETSNPTAWREGLTLPGVALTDAEGNLLAREAIDPAQAHRDDLTPAIERVCIKAGCRPRDIRLIGVSIGPGGYTAVRIGVMTAQVIAEATGAACVGVPTAHIAMESSVAHDAKQTTTRVAVALASKGEKAYVTLYEGSRVVVEGLMDGEMLASYSPGVLLADSYIPAGFKAQPALGGIIAPLHLDPLFAARLASVYTPCADPATLMPLYPREPEAVTKWRALHPSL